MAFFLVTAGLGGLTNCGQQAKDSNRPFLQGNWEVTGVTGFIHRQVPGGSAWCDPVDEKIYPILDKDQTFIGFTNEVREPRLKDMPRDTYDTLNRVLNPEGLFLFQFGFDNGPQGNTVLESFGAPYHHTELIMGLWTFEVGYWGDAEKLESAQTGSLDRSLGPGIVMEGEVVSGNKWGGKGSFHVTGRLVDEHRIEGSWRFEETTAGPANIPECTSVSYGTGTWVAVQK